MKIFHIILALSSALCIYYVILMTDSLTLVKILIKLTMGQPCPLFGGHYIIIIYQNNLKECVFANSALNNPIMPTSKVIAI